MYQINKFSGWRGRAKSNGFSLIEVAVVLVIVSALLGGLLVSLSATRQISNRNESGADIEQFIEALYGFAQANGRLPCPAISTSNGFEAPVGGSDNVTPCTQQHGFIPSATLGLSGAFNTDNLLMDPWLNPYRYSVSTTRNNAYTSSPPNGIANATMAVLLNVNDGLQVCTAAACGTVIADALPAVLVSMGPDWAEFTGADADATENMGEATINGYRLGNDDRFVATDFIEDVFDDLIAWPSPNILFTKMITARQLP